MAITYDASKLDTGNFAEWCERSDYDSTPWNNGQLFESFIFRMAAFRPMTNGTFDIESCKIAILRNRLYENATIDGPIIPDEFIRRMIGLETNIFPRKSDDDFDMFIGRLIRENTLRYMPTGWDNF